MAELTTRLTAAERETTVTTTDDDHTVRIWTSRARHIGELKRNGKFRLVAEGHHGTSVWAEFEIDDADWSPATGARRKVTMSDERKAQLREQLARSRQ